MQALPFYINFDITATSYRDQDTMSLHGVAFLHTMVRFANPLHIMKKKYTVFFVF